VPTRPWISADRAAALILIVGFAAYGVRGHSLESSLGVDFVGPGFFPTAVGILGVVLAGILLVRREPVREGGERANPSLELRALVPIGLMLAYVLSLDFLGFPIATLAFLVLTVRYLGAPSWLGAAVFGLAGTAAAILLFQYGFSLRLPQGDLIRLW
jgi:putative tricarboxylic transport membrane protein